MGRVRLTEPDTSLADLMSAWPQTIPVFLRHRMLCVGCLVSPFHTVGDACAAYHLNKAAFLAELMQAADLT